MPTAVVRKRPSTSDISLTQLTGESEYRGRMTSERDPNPSEREVESDFSIPEDADFTTPGDPIRNEEDEPRAATPGNPIADDHDSSHESATPGEPLDDTDRRRDEAESAGGTTPGNPIGR